MGHTVHLYTYFPCTTYAQKFNVMSYNRVERDVQCTPSNRFVLCLGSVRFLCSLVNDCFLTTRMVNL